MGGLFTAGLFMAGINMAEFLKIRQIIPAINIHRHKYPFKNVSNFDKFIVFSGLLQNLSQTNP